MSRNDFRFFHRLRVRWSEVDRQGIVFYAQYLNYLEVATQEYFHHLGLGIYAMAELKIFDIVTAKVTVEFHAPARVDDLLDIGVKLGEFGNRSFSSRGEVFPALQSEAIAVIAVHNVTIDPVAVRAIPVPQEFRAAVEKFEATGQPAALEQFPTLSKARSR